MKDNNYLMNQRKTMKRFNSYKDDGNTALSNWLYSNEIKKHYFKQDKAWQVLGTDVTEFHVNGFKVFLSTIIDFYDSKPISWSISKYPNNDLMLSNLISVKKIAPKNNSFILHMDRGSVYRGHEYKQFCLNNNILQSMSRKGKSGDNAPVEGFFGRLKQMWFNKSSFKGYTYNQFIYELDSFLSLYKNDFVN